MGAFFNYIRLMRPEQWYKNLVVFIALVFTGQMFDIEPMIISLAGFATLCMVSSSNYIINDIFDREKDRQHPEKRKRPIASKKVKVGQGLFFAIILLALSVTLSIYLSKIFLIAVLSLFALTFAYSFGLKRELFLDVIIIGVNFVLRAISGAFILDVDLSPWLVICTFFVALLLGFAKRHAELTYLGDNAIRHRIVLKDYTKDMLTMLISMSSTLLILSFALYSFLKQETAFMLTLPFVVYGVFRFVYLAQKGDIIGRKPHMLIKDSKLLFTGTILGLIILVILYV